MSRKEKEKDRKRCLKEANEKVLETEGGWLYNNGDLLSVPELQAESGKFPVNVVLPH